MSRRILLAAGGTGGHIIPAIAFGQWLLKQGEEVVWLTGSRSLEEQIFSAHGVHPEKLPLEGSPLGVSGVRSLKRWKQLWGAFFKSRALLKEKRSDVCVLFGGYLSMPVLLGARSLHIPILMHEQNTVAGKVTRLAVKMGVPVTCAWDECNGLGGTGGVPVGMPLRPLSLVNRGKAQKALLGYELPEGEKLLVILGGSLGSGGMKNVLQKSQNMIKSTGYKILCMGIGPEQKPFAEAFVHPACWDMSLVYSAADAVVCRAGASTLAELSALGLPAVVVPWAASADDHQNSNARKFSALTGAPILLEDSEPEEFVKALASLPERREAHTEKNSGSKDLYHVMCSLTS